jgi:hypothetical protein
LKTKIHLPDGRVSPREPELPVKNLGNWQLPEAGFKEKVYYHEDLSTGDDGIATVVVHNPHFPVINRSLKVQLSWKTSSLPVMVQWKMHGEGTHVLGIEPAICHVEGRSAEQERGTLVMLAPGQSMDYELKISITEDRR